MNRNNTIKIDAEAQNHINAYIDYQYNAGVSDKPFTPEVNFQKKNKKKLISQKLKKKPPSNPHT